MPKKKWPRLMIATTAAAAVALSTSGMAYAAPADIQQASVIESVEASDQVAETPGLSKSAKSKIATLVPESATTIEGEVVTDSAITTVPTAENPSITTLAFDDGQEVSLGLPQADLVESEGAVSTFAADDGESFHAQVTDDGAIQIVNVVEKETDEHKFEIKTSIPSGSSWKAVKSGGLELTNRSGEVLAIIGTPWAIDANGKELPTKFAIDGEKITQIVDTEGAAFPVVSDPSLWWVIGTSALCIAEIGSLAVGAAKVVQAFAKSEKIIKATKGVIKAYNKLGGTMKSVIGKLKKYVKNKSSLTKAQRVALEEFIRKVGSSVFNILGLGSCYDLATNRS